VLIAVNFLITEVILVGEVRLEGQMVAALSTLEALFVEYHLVHRPDFLDGVHSVPATRTLLRRRRDEQLAKTFRRRGGGRERIAGRGSHLCRHGNGLTHNLHALEINDVNYRSTDRTGVTMMTIR